MTDLDPVKQRQQAMWAAGDYSAIGMALYPTAEVLCEDVGFSGGRRVLDLACGSGNVAALLERAQQRAAAEGMTIAWREADAEALPFADASFDVVLSAFGVMFAPDQARAAAELVRVCRPGGLIGLANWTAAGATTDLFRLGAQFAPAPPDPDPLAPGLGHRRRPPPALRRAGAADQAERPVLAVPLPDRAGVC